MSNQVTVMLESIARGAVSEQFDIALAEVLNNISDPNTLVSKAREIQLNIKFMPSDDRASAAVTCQSKTKLVPPTAVGALIVIDRDESGKVVAQELVQSELIPTERPKVVKIK